MASWVREVTPSFTKTFRRWYSTVLVVMKSWAAISWFRSPAAASRAIWASCGVRAVVEGADRFRTCSPVAASSAAARDAKRVAPIASKVSRASCSG